MSHHTVAHTALAVTLVAALCGCLGPREVQPVQRYAIHPDIAAPDAPATEYTLGVRPLVSSLPYGLRMVYLEGRHRLGTLPAAEWGEQPAEAVTRALVDALTASGRFQDVGDAANMNRPDYILTGDLRRFHENRTGQPWTAEIEVRLELRAAMGTANPWSATLHEAIPVENGAEATPADFAAAMNTAISNIAARTAEAAAGAPLEK